MTNQPRNHKPADKNVGAPIAPPKTASRPPFSRKKRYIYNLVHEKREWQEPSESEEAAREQSIGSRGWYTRGFLPHYDKPGTMQMITFRLADAMPASLRHEWEHLLKIEDEREKRTKLESYLDRGHGECLLKLPAAATALEQVLLRFEDLRYRVLAWIIMPNHAHILVELWDLPICELLKGWKGASARAINRLLGRTGELWQREFWDRYIRDEGHYAKAKHYIEWNPVKARLVREPQHWPYSSANPKWQWSEVNRYCRGALLNNPYAAKPDQSANIGAPTFLSAKNPPQTPG
jgi:REP element-mobilizing transposase RayT